MHMPISEEVSKRITSLRYLMILFIVFLHSIIPVYIVVNTFQDIAPKQYTYFMYVCNTFKNLAAGSVGVFFIFSSFLQFVKNYDYKTLLIKKTKGLLIPYIAWISIAILTKPLLKILVARIAPSLLNDPNNISILHFTFNDWIEIYTGIFATSQNPYLMQFWFIRDLFILSIISPLLLYIEKRLPFLQLFLSIFLLISNFNFEPIIYNERIITAYFFYIIGMYWAIYEIHLFHLVDKFKWKACIIFLAILVLLSDKINLNIYIKLTIPIIIMMLKLSKHIIKNERLFLLSKNLSAYSFFLFSIHMPFLIDSFITKLCTKVFPMNNIILWLLDYLLVGSLVTIIGTFVGFIVRRFCKPIYVLLNGGR